jgi:hypothetical protein
VVRVPWVLAFLPLGLSTGCETPSVPFDEGQYDFRLNVSTPAGSFVRTFHWGPGAEVAVFVNSASAEGRPSLATALDRASETWTRAALFSEVRVRQTTDLGEAMAVLQWADAEPVLSTPPGCTGPVTGAASTVGCLNETADSLRTWRRRDGGPSQVLFSVFVKVRPDLDDELLERVVAHEAGHVLGILAHSLDARDLMWAGDLSSASPSGADRQTLRSLYQAPVDLSY